MRKAFLVVLEADCYEGQDIPLCVVESEEAFGKLINDLIQAIKEKRSEFFIGDNKFVWEDRTNCFYCCPWFLVWENLRCREITCLF